MKLISFSKLQSKENPIEMNIEIQTPGNLPERSNYNSDRRLNLIKEDLYSQDISRGNATPNDLLASASGGKSISSNGKKRRSSTLREKIQIDFGLANLSIQKKLPDNRISTTKYTPSSFVPKSLFFQFKRAANIYFLIVSILTCLDFSPKRPSSMIGTFSFVLLATMVKEFFEDYSRHKQDKASNDRKVLRLSSDGWGYVKCHKLKPGDIVKINKEEEFSADCLIVQSSNINGYCYIDTKNLDGETNLKEKSAIEDYKHLEELKDFNGVIKCEKTNENLHSFDGVITSTHDNKCIFINIRNLILKGCTLKNTDFAIGTVIYTGKNTKIMKNSKQPTIKVSKILKTMNILLYSLFLFTVAICVVLSGFSLKFKLDSTDQREYIFNKYLNTLSEKSEVLYYFIKIIIFFVAYSNIIPISLYVALEMVKIFQGVLIYYDDEIYDFAIDKPARCRSTDLIEELGQIEFIFSDKTGTLTQNCMILKKCFIAGDLYGKSDDDIGNLSCKNGQPGSFNKNASSNVLKLKENSKFTINGDFTAYEILREKDPSVKRLTIHEFFTNLSLCHSVFPEMTDKGIIYQGSSPDDIALVQGASQLGYVFESKDFNKLTLKNEVINSFKQYELLVEMPFDSDRKRMSVIVKDIDSGKIILYSKGADGIMEKRINWGLTSTSDYELSHSAIDDLCREGYRCLMFGQREIKPSHFKKWMSVYSSAQSKGRDVSKYYDEMENGMKFLGITAIEDKLQEGVGSTIHSLINCEIRIWVLTGDKQDTAIEIAKSCKLIQDNTLITRLVNPENIEDLLIELIEKFQLNTDNFLGSDFINKLKIEGLEEYNEVEERKKVVKFPDLKKIKDHVRNINLDMDSAFIIDGPCLEIVLESQALSTAFFYLASSCISVICCRVSPKQKSKVVKLAKTHGKWITLSIGDGANDVPMIMEAHIGIGIQGKEGTQAVRSSDFCIGQFCFLEKIILDYGRNGYIKISKFICYYFYKNILLALTEFYFSIYNGFSGQIFFADYLNTMYNAFFTSWPCLLTFIFEKEHNVFLIRKFPSLYKAGQIDAFFNLKVFWRYVFYSIIHSTICFHIPFYCLRGVINDSGLTYNMWYISTISFSSVIHVSTLKLLLISDYWNSVNVFGAFASIVFYYVCLFILSNDTFSIMFQPEITGIPYNVVFDSKGMILLLILPILTLFPDFVIRSLSNSYFPLPAKYLKLKLNCKDLKSLLLKEESFQTATAIKHKSSKLKSNLRNKDNRQIKGKLDNISSLSDKLTCLTPKLHKSKLINDDDNLSISSGYNSCAIGGNKREMQSSHSFVAESTFKPKSQTKDPYKKISSFESEQSIAKKKEVKKEQPFSFFQAQQFNNIGTFESPLKDLEHLDIIRISQTKFEQLEGSNYDLLQKDKAEFSQFLNNK